MESKDCYPYRDKYEMYNKPVKFICLGELIGHPKKLCSICQNQLCKVRGEYEDM